MAVDHRLFTKYNNERSMAFSAPCALTGRSSPPTLCTLLVAMRTWFHRRKQLMKKRKRFLLLIVYIGFLLVALEGISRITLAIPWSANKLFSDDDLSWRRAWVSRQDSGSGLYYSFDRYCETKGWATRANLRDETVFGDKTLNTNSRGLRGTREFPYQQDSDRLRVIVLGDSFTFGDEVSDDETYAHYLQQMLPEAEVINMGVHGYGHDQMLILLREEGVRYRPDVVILGFNSFDMERNVLGFRDYAKPKFEVGEEGLQLTNSPVASPEEILRFDWLRPRAWDIWSIIRLRVRIATGRYHAHRDRVTRMILDEIVDTCHGAGARPLFIHLPGDDELTGLHQATRAESFLLDYGRSNERVTCATARPHFLAGMDRGTVYKDEGHWCPGGHLTVAESIYQLLLAEGLVQPLP